MPNRIIREGWIESERISQLGAEAEVFFLRLCLRADDFGRFHGNPILLKSSLYPLSDEVKSTDISRFVAACEAAGVIRCYEADGKKFIQIDRFDQRTRAQKSKFPPPAGAKPPVVRHVSDNGLTNDRRSRTDSETESEADSEPHTQSGNAHRGDQLCDRLAEQPRVRCSFPDALKAVPAFVACWEKQWIPYQIERKGGRPPTINTLERQLQTCLRLGAGRAISALQSAIEKGWAAPDENAKVVTMSAGRPWDEAPDDWKAYWRETYPPEDFPDAPRYEDGEWHDVQSDHRKMIWEGMQKRRRRSA